MSAPVTEAHIAKAQASGYTTEKGVQMAAQFIANNEAAKAERDQLRAECNNLRADLDAIKAIRDEETARAERAEAEVERLRHLEALLNQAAAEVTAHTFTAGGIAGLRAENERLRRAYVRPDDIRAQLESAAARASLSETELRAELALLREWQREVIQNANAHHAEREEAIARAERAEAELAGIRALANRRNKRDHSQDTTHQLVAALDQALDIAQAELAATKSTLDEEVNCAEKAEHEVVRQYARAERAEAELHALRLICGTTDADKFSTWVDRANARAEKAEAELATERARLDYMSNCGFEHLHNETGDHLGHEWTISGYGESRDVTLRDVIDAEMKEETK